MLFKGELFLILGGLNNGILLYFDILMVHAYVSLNKSERYLKIHIYMYHKCSPISIWKWIGENLKVLEVSSRVKNSHTSTRPAKDETSIQMTTRA